MKIQTQTAICLALLTMVNWTAAQESGVPAKETFAPLISENCIAFVHVDFGKLEVDTVKTVIQKTGEEILRELRFDEESFDATTRELAIELEKLDVIVRPVWETITKELGITEVAVVFDLDLLEKEMPPVFAVPWKNKTDAQLETLYALTQAPENAFIKVDGFLIPMDGFHAEEVAEWAKTVKPAPENAPIYEALKSVAGAEVKAVAVLPEQLRTMARSGAGLPPDMPNEVRGLIMFAAQRVQWASACVSLSEILGGQPRENSDVLLTIKTARATDATMLRGMLEQLIEFGVSTARFGMEQVMKDMRNEEIPPVMRSLLTSPVVFSFAKGALRTLLPDAEGDKLIFRAKGGTMSSQVTVATVGASIALLLPAVQAAREAARRMQCSNNLKQIILALHNYHDVNNGFPPLYTVDADGKPLHSWRVLILPYIEQAALYSQIRLDEPWDSPHNSQFHNMTISVYACPSNPLTRGGSGLTAYSAIAGEGLVPATAAGRMTGRGLRDITDGTSNTIAIVEVRQGFNWMDPTADVTLDDLVNEFHRFGRVGSFHTGGMDAARFDGSVFFIPETIDRQILRALGTIAGGESVSF